MTLSQFGLTVENLTTLIFLYSALFLIIVVAMVVLFYVKGFAIYKMSRSLKIKRSWYGFIPFFSVYAFGRISDQANFEKSTYRKILLAISVLKTLFTGAFLCFTTYFSVKLIFAADKAVFEGTNLDSNIFNDFIPAIGFFIICLVLCLLYRILNCVCAVKVYNLFGAKNAILNAIIGLLIPIAFPCFLFSLSNKEPKKEKNKSKADGAVFSIDG